MIAEPRRYVTHTSVIVRAMQATKRVSGRLHIPVPDAAYVLAAWQESLTILVAEQAAWERLSSYIPAVPQLSISRLSDYT